MFVELETAMLASGFALINEMLPPGNSDARDRRREKSLQISLCRFLTTLNIGICSDVFRRRIKF